MCHIALLIPTRARCAVQGTAGFVGPTDMWHQHINACLGPHGPLVGADGVGVCTRDMQDPGRWAWMLHVWAVPEWASPEGVFSMVNMALP